MALIVTQKEINLLTGSKIINDYPLLQEFIINTPDLTWDKLLSLRQEAQIFFNDIYPKVRSQVIQEWVVDKGSVDYVEGNKVSCELCGHRPIKNICVIENSFTKKKLKVGTECVEYFGIGKDLDIKMLSKEAKKIKLLEKLNSIFQGIENKIDNWEDIIDSQDIIIKNDIKEKYINYGYKIRELYNTYCDDKTKEFVRNNIINEIELLLENGNNEIVKIEKYINQIRNNPLAPKKFVFRDMSEPEKSKTIKMIEEDGLIKARTLWRINNLEFSNSLIEAFNVKLEENNFRIESTSNYKGKIGYFIVYNKMKKYKLFCTYKEFCSNCFSIITEEDQGIKIDLDLFINIGEIIDALSLERAIYDIFSMIKNNSISVHYTDFNFDEIIIKKDNLYYFLKMNDFVDSFKREIILGSSDFSGKIVKWISNKLTKSYSRADIDYLLYNREKNSI